MQDEVAFVFRSSPHPYSIRQYRYAHEEEEEKGGDGYN
jgi:hypothetical protein